MEATAEAPQCGGDFGHFCDREGLNLGTCLDRAAFYYLSPGVSPTRSRAHSTAWGDANISSSHWLIDSIVANCVAISVRTPYNKSASWRNVYTETFLGFYVVSVQDRAFEAVPHPPPGGGEISPRPRLSRIVGPSCW